MTSRIQRQTLNSDRFKDRTKECLQLQVSNTFLLTCLKKFLVGSVFYCKTLPLSMVDKTAPRQQPLQTEDLRVCVRACGLVLEDRRSIITTMLLGGVKAIDLATIDCHTCGHPTVTTYNPLYTRVYRKCSHDSMLGCGGGATDLWGSYETSLFR